MWRREQTVVPFLISSYFSFCPLGFFWRKPLFVSQSIKEKSDVAPPHILSQQDTPHFHTSWQVNIFQFWATWHTAHYSELTLLWLKCLCFVVSLLIFRGLESAHFVPVRYSFVAVCMSHVSSFNLNICFFIKFLSCEEEVRHSCWTHCYNFHPHNDRLHCLFI